MLSDTPSSLKAKRKDKYTTVSGRCSQSFLTIKTYEAVFKRSSLVFTRNYKRPKEPITESLFCQVQFSSTFFLALIKNAVLSRRYLSCIILKSDQFNVAWQMDQTGQSGVILNLIRFSLEENTKQINTSHITVTQIGFK